MSWQWWRWRTSFHSSLRRTPLGFSDPIGEGDSRAWGPRQCTISLTHRHRTFLNNFSMEEWFTLPHTCFAHGTDLTSASHGKHRSPRQQPEVGVFLNRPHYYNKTTTDFFSEHCRTLVPGMDSALHFIAAFPEARSWHVTILTPEKRCVVNKPAIATEELRKSLGAWLQLHAVHIFVRPLISRLVFLDLDQFQGHWADLVALQPRIISQTSPGNFQWWATLGQPVEKPRAYSWAAL